MILTTRRTSSPGSSLTSFNSCAGSSDSPVSTLPAVRPSLTRPAVVTATTLTTFGTGLTLRTGGAALPLDTGSAVRTPWTGGTLISAWTVTAGEPVVTPVTLRPPNPGATCATRVTRGTGSTRGTASPVATC